MGSGTALFATAYLFNPPLYSDAMCSDSSRKLTIRERQSSAHPDEIAAQSKSEKVTSTNVPDHSLDLESLAGTCTTMSRKLTLSPQRQRRLPRRQCAQMGVASSHLRCRSRQVKHPVRTRFPFATFVMIVSGPVRFQSGPGMGVSGRCRLHALPKKRWRFRQRMETRRDEETDDDDDTGWLL